MIGEATGTQLTPLQTLHQCTAALLASDPDKSLTELGELMVELGMMDRLVKEAGEVFLAAHKQLEKEEAERESHLPNVPPKHG